MGCNLYNLPQEKTKNIALSISSYLKIELGNMKIILIPLLPVNQNKNPYNCNQSRYDYSVQSFNILQLIDVCMILSQTIS